jgi:hypothetical protein
MNAGRSSICQGMSIPNYKDIVDLLKKGFTIEAQEKIMELREAAMELQEENLKLRERVNQMEAELKVSKTLKFRDEAYWLDDDTVPFCHVCYDRDRKMIHLHDASPFGFQWKCPVCKEHSGARIMASGHGTESSSGRMNRTRDF